MTKKFHNFKESEGKYMEEKFLFECVGDLSEELVEIDKLLPYKERLYSVDSKTVGCGHFLTIYCC